MRFQRILFLTDFSEVSVAALPHAISLAEEYQSGLTVLHIAERPVSEDWKTTKEDLIRSLEKLTPSQSQIGWSAECIVEHTRPPAPPAERILEIATDRSADLIVFGVRPIRGKFGFRAHIASTTAQILAQANFPVLTVRSGY